jgi:hypothetical protein
MPMPLANHRNILDLSITTGGQHNGQHNGQNNKQHNGQNNNPGLIGLIQLSSNRVLSVVDLHRAGATVRVTTSQPDGERRFALHLSLVQLPTLIDLLCEVEQGAIDRGDLPECRDDDQDDRGSVL